MRATLVRLVRRLGERAKAGLLPAIRHEREALGIRDAAGDETRGAIDRLKQQARRDAEEAAEQATEELQREAARHTRRWVATINAGVGIDIAALLQADDVADILSVRAAAIAGLMESLSAEVQGKIAQVALAGIYGGGTDAVAKEIADILNTGFRRAKLIARDQMAKLNSDLNEYRQREIGVTRYRWKTILDGRERPHHHERNNDLFRWDSPPFGGHPGREINCRCRALAIIELPGEETET